MPHDNRGTSEQNNGLYGHSVLCFAEKRFFKWELDDVSVSLRNRSGSYGGGSEVLVIQNAEDNHVPCQYRAER